MICFLIAVNFLLAFKLGWDYYAKNVQKRIINHQRSAIIDGAIYTACILYFGLDYGWFFIALSFRWILFDLLFNLLNKDKWNHYGTSSVLDKFLSKTGKWHLVIKLIPAIVGIILLTYGNIQ